MADFSSYLSDTDESAVEDLIAQAEDHVALDHISSLNLSLSSLLPAHLESRFQNLKSFPPRLPRTEESGGVISKSELGKVSERRGGSDRESGLGLNAEFNDEKKTRKEDGKREAGLVSESELEKMGKHKAGGSSGSNSSGSFPEDTIFMPQKPNPFAEKENPHMKATRGPSRGRSGGSGFNEALGWGDSSPSPPRKGGCFWCSPKKKTPRKNKDLEMDMGWGKHEELLSDLGSFSAKEQRRVLKEAMKEQERLSKEAEKIVRIAKQASARMRVYGDSSDDETKL